MCFIKNFVDKINTENRSVVNDVNDGKKPADNPYWDSVTKRTKLTMAIYDVANNFLSFKKHCIARWNSLIEKLKIATTEP